MFVRQPISNSNAPSEIPAIFPRLFSFSELIQYCFAQNMGEALLWILGNLLTTVIIVNLCSDYAGSMDRYKVTESISLVPAEEIPFPSVIIDAGDNLDPMSHVREWGRYISPEEMNNHSKQECSSLIAVSYPLSL